MTKHGVGLSLPNRGVLFGATTVREMLDLATEADRSGFFTSVWVGDGLISKPRLESVVSLSAIAAVTSTVRLGVCCLATFPLRHPVLFAAQWASLDVASDGRTQLAVCLGATTERSGQSVAAELRAMGVAGGERVARFEEGVEAVRALWAGPTPTWAGSWTWTGSTCCPSRCRTRARSGSRATRTRTGSRRSGSPRPSTGSGASPTAGSPR
ncbi:hypothetical protein BJF78_30720 [Pseudonocardia sp. CNS-139]|nr:hypothetical protein BJF78_30720 [Pseudonocardia sp. CNS-139]